MGFCRYRYARMNENKEIVDFTFHVDFCPRPFDEALNSDGWIKIRKMRLGRYRRGAGKTHRGGCGALGALGVTRPTRYISGLGNSFFPLHSRVLKILSIF